MHYIAANIGRNIGDTPMPLDRWQDFQRETAQVLAYAGLPEVAGIIAGTGGAWQGEPEESAHVWQLLPHKPRDMDNVRHALGTLARAYGQDAIALIVGESTLV